MDNLWETEQGCLTSQSVGRKQEVWQVVGRKGCCLSQSHHPALCAYHHLKLTVCTHVPILVKVLELVSYSCLGFLVLAVSVGIVYVKPNDRLRTFVVLGLQSVALSVC